ncbi:MAG: hypothetical protein ACFFC3_06235 [Candidatus Odinarchaeota archaeon]
MVINNATRPKGLPLNSQGPIIKSLDIYGKPVDLDELLKIHNGVLIDFFRGTW